MNVKRILSGIIGLPIVALLLIFGNKYIIDVIFAIVAIISIYEYFNAIGKKYKPVKWLGYLLALMIAFIHIISLDVLIKIIVMLIPIIIAILFITIIISDMKINFNDIACTFFGICYIVGFLIFIPLLYGVGNGKFLIWYILISAWGTDTCAYIVGMKFGKHKFSKISPKKSIEGCIGGTIGAVAISLIYTMVIRNYIDFNIAYWYIGIMSAILSILSQIGDLSASSIKRNVDIKDFGNLIPGHGGMLDRIDSIIFIAPFAYFMLTFLI